MPAPALQLEPPADGASGIGPWIVAGLAGVALFAALGERLAHIPASLEREARERVARLAPDAAPDATSGVSVSVDGRDLVLAGELDAGIDRSALVSSVAAVDGVRVVVDELVVVDPVALARDARERFRAALAGIDVSGVAFEPGSASIVAGSEAALAAVARLMRETPGQRVRIAGHTDSRGRAAVNLALSRERARAVAADLADRGVERSRIIAQGYGATQPVADNATESGRARNRRIEIVNID